MRERIAEYILLIATVLLFTTGVVFIVRGLIMCPLLTLGCLGGSLAFAAFVWALFVVTSENMEEGPGPK